VLRRLHSSQSPAGLSQKVHASGNQYYSEDAIQHECGHAKYTSAEFATVTGKIGDSLNVWRIIAHLIYYNP